MHLDPQPGSVLVWKSGRIVGPYLDIPLDSFPKSYNLYREIHRWGHAMDISPAMDMSITCLHITRSIGMNVLYPLAPVQCVLELRVSLKIPVNPLRHCSPCSDTLAEGGRKAISWKGTGESYFAKCNNEIVLVRSQLLDISCLIRKFSVSHLGSSVNEQRAICPIKPIVDDAARGIDVAVK
ncbi:hypothetical protein EVAR_98774_1 [Eumeta japonica]|uniref:Uncharacterized protein n=1 Tax=Eumeta variegata TaxID=151549 RepID=A0A4C1YWH2_EUMVA|nr:hypothetical protein EVAR_98774_1 [Eumeta japonica]